MVNRNSCTRVWEMENLSVSAKGSRGRTGLKASSYTDNLDYPPIEEDEDEEEFSVEKTRTKHKGKQIQVDFSISAKHQKKKLQIKERLELEAAAQKEALKEEDDHDAFTVVIGTKTSVLEGEDTVDANVKDITISWFSVSVRGKELYKNASVMISHGKRYGLVGPNGMGKSTLLKLIAWRKVPVPKNIDLLLVEQEVVGDEKSAIEAVVCANEELVKLREEAESLVQNQNDDDDGGEKLAEIYDRLQMLGSDAAEAHASKVLSGLGFTKHMLVRPTKSFSGGWRMRISIARALFLRPSLLLLDEPTNHLDLRAVLWLEEYLCSWKNRTLVVVSHDVGFLNSVCTDIIHLHDQKLHLYRGNFDAFESGYEQRRKEVNRKYESHLKREKAAKRSGNRVQQEKVKDRAKFEAAKEASKKGGKAKKDMDEDDPVPEAPKKWTDYSVVLDFPEPTELPGPPHLQLIDVSFCYPGREGFRLSDVDVGIDMGMRVAIVGPNGAGKSTLLNLLAGDLVPTEGEVRRSQKLRIGRYSQHFVDQLTMEQTPVEYLFHLYPDQWTKVEQVRAKLGKFGLPAYNHKTPIAKLSGGQKARVVLASISMSRPHILLLDEPTNHLDMQTVDALGDALDRFQGGVVLVSHDSRLISRVCEDEEKSQIWVVEDGTVDFFQGTFDDYKEELRREIKAEVDDLNSLVGS